MCLVKRFYDPELARFLQEDTYRGQQSNPLSLNLYTYCFNNPLIYWDPTGHVVTAWDKANCTSAQIKQIEQATKDYDAAKAKGDKAGMEAAHAVAVAARTPNLGANQSVASNGYVVSKGTQVSVSTPSGTQTGYIYNGATYMENGSRPQDGWIVHAPNGVNYQMNAQLGYGKPTNVINVTLPYGNTVQAGLSGGKTTMLDGKSPSMSSVVHTANGNYLMTSEGYGVKIQESWQKSTGPKLSVFEEEDYIVVYARLYIFGEASEDIIGGVSYKQAFIEGVTTYWSGVYNNKPVAMLVDLIDDGEPFRQDRTAIHVEIRKVLEDNHWPSSSPIGINMFIGDASHGIGHTYPLEDFRATSAHEFGHAGFHLRDIYIDSRSGQTDDEIGNPFPSMMNRQFEVDGAQLVDYTVIFEKRTWEGDALYKYSWADDILDKLIVDEDGIPIWR